MDFQFRTDMLGEPSAKCDIECEAFGDWLSNDLGTDRESINTVLDAIENLLCRNIPEYQFIGKEYTLTIEDDEVILTLNHNETSHKEFAEDYDEEMQAGCGLADFKHLLQEWKAFIR
ncbi:hypothetical protein CW735_04090 [Alteromonas sp. MB-3u-76]|uniref:UPF0231 family protein n=1 Tax=unclassified Alteromonas TaxID=2614992 RepID=UPI00090335FC|nr:MULTISPECIES: YacL family protein [unclassified Alteromonas]APE04659.1 hypothetical protein BM528_01765 [Alteromonas sp. RW2A1]AUC87478.1 hypothetical protein CW735_04090 [Alteromonas sp. MB-3u-76]